MILRYRPPYQKSNPQESEPDIFKIFKNCWVYRKIDPSLCPPSG